MCLRSQSLAIISVAEKVFGLSADDRFARTCVGHSLIEHELDSASGSRQAWGSPPTDTPSPNSTFDIYFCAQTRRLLLGNLTYDTTAL